MAVLNVCGYYDSMEAMLQRAVDERFFPPDGHGLYAIFDSVPRLMDYVEAYEAVPMDIWKEKIFEKYDREGG